MTETELKLTLEMLTMRRQMIETHAQIMQHQIEQVTAEIISTQERLDELRIQHPSPN